MSLFSNAKILQTSYTPGKGNRAQPGEDLRSKPLVYLQPVDPQYPQSGFVISRSSVRVRQLAPDSEQPLFGREPKVRVPFAAEWLKKSERSDALRTGAKGTNPTVGSRFHKVPLRTRTEGSRALRREVAEKTGAKRRFPHRCQRHQSDSWLLISGTYRSRGKARGRLQEPCKPSAG